MTHKIFGRKPAMHVHGVVVHMHLGSLFPDYYFVWSILANSCINQVVVAGVFVGF